MWWLTVDLHRPWGEESLSSWGQHPSWKFVTHTHFLRSTIPMRRHSKHIKKACENITLQLTLTWQLPKNHIMQSARVLAGSDIQELFAKHTYIMWMHVSMCVWKSFSEFFTQEDQVFWDMMPCQLVNSYWHCRVAYCIPLQELSSPHTQKTEQQVPLKCP